MASTDAILLVTDIPDHAHSYCEALTAVGFAVMVCARGGEAVATAVDDPPDLLVIDVRLPDMTGWDVCREVKRQPAAGNPPVIVLTDDVTRTCADESAKAGCNAWLARPTRADDIVRAVRQVLALDLPEPPSPESAVLGVRTCPACDTESIRATLRMSFIQYYCCRECGLCWRVDTQPL